MRSSDFVTGCSGTEQYHMTGAVFTFGWRSILRHRSLDANILGSSDPINLFLGLFESPCSGLYERKKSIRIGSLDSEILAFKD